MKITITTKYWRSVSDEHSVITTMEVDGVENFKFHQSVSAPVTPEEYEKGYAKKTEMMSALLLISKFQDKVRMPT